LEVIAFGSYVDLAMMEIEFEIEIWRFVISDSKFSHKIVVYLVLSFPSEYSTTE